MTTAPRDTFLLGDIMEINMQEITVEIAKIGAQMNETNRRLESIERNQERAMEAVNSAVIKSTEHEGRLDDHDRRLVGIEGALGWVVKIVLGVVCMAVLGLIIVKGVHVPTLSV
jgi:hypothetical protein